MTKRKFQEPSDGDEPTNEKDTSSSSLLLVESDKGHRFGNFHNYYAFHPPSARVDLLSEPNGILDYIVAELDRQSDGDTASVTYTDVGCNEGALTLQVAKALASRGKPKLHVTGIDIDPALIERASDKWQKEQLEDGTTSTKQIQATFQVGNVLTNSNVIPTSDLTTLFSTTMWLHIHGGDDGLRKVLRTLCRQTRHFVVIESQPSKCYRSAMVRLRRLGRPEVDVSSERLKLRSDIDTHMESILQECSFQLVRLGVSSQPKTEWNRSVRLFERQSTT